VRAVPIAALRAFVSPSLGQWKGLQSVVMVERKRKSRVRAQESTSTTRTFYLCSHPAHKEEDAVRIGQAIRAHWLIENGQHWLIENGQHWLIENGQHWLIENGQHWLIENGQHWGLDVVWQEDASRVRRDQAPKILALLRRLATNILRQDTTYDISLSLKRKTAAWNTDFLLQKLVSAKPQPAPA